MGGEGLELSGILGVEESIIDYIGLLLVCGYTAFSKGSVEWVNVVLVLSSKGDGC